MPRVLRSRAAFTLIELLVVIGIIAILISILIPALAAARRQANLLQCASNLRQVYQGCTLHAQEHAGYFPLAGHLNIDTGGQWHVESYARAFGDPMRKRYTYAYAPASAVYVIAPLPAAIAPYLGWRNLSYENWQTLDRELNNPRAVWQMFMCPGNARPLDTTMPNQGAMMVVSVNGKLTHQWSTNTDLGLNEAVLGFDYRPQYKPRRLAGKLGHVRRPAETMLVCDANLASEPDPIFTKSFPSPWIMMAPALEWDYAVTLADVLAQNARVMPLRGRIDRVRHRGRINICFVDGHVETAHIAERSLQRVFLLAR